MIGIINYGAGNLRSLKNAFEKISVSSAIVNSPGELGKCSKIVLPGVGAFGEIMLNMRKCGMDRAIIDSIDSGKPFLGICLGMQALFEWSEENLGTSGLGVLKGQVRRFSGTLKVPQMGWNKIEIERDSKLFENIATGSFVYFANSFFPEPADNSLVLSRTTYGKPFCSALDKGNLFAVQFHPEKSGETGLRVLKNFAKS